MLHRYGEQQDVAFWHLMGDGEVFGQGDAGQTRVLAAGAHGGGVGGVAGPEGDVFACARVQHGQSGAPGAGADDGDFWLCFMHLHSSIRISVPLEWPGSPKMVSNAFRMGAASSANPKGGLMMSRPQPFSFVGSTGGRRRNSTLMTSRILESFKAS